MSEVFHDDVSHWLINVVPFLEISQNDDNLLALAFLEKVIKFDFEDDLEDSVIRCTVSTDVCRPHIEEYNVSRGQSKERCSSLKSLS